METATATSSPALIQTPLPVGRQGQIRTLQRQLEWSEKAVAQAQVDAQRSMCDGDASVIDRWDAVRRLRTLAWKVCREILPLTGKVPAGVRAHPDFRDVERAAHALRRRTEDALRDNANYTIDLVAAEATPLVGTRRS